MTASSLCGNQTKIVGVILEDITNLFFAEVMKDTEAAAATAVIIGIKMAPKIPVVFRADRPFLFFIYEKSNGVILFMGRLQKP